MPLSFDPMEDDVSLAQEDEMMQDLCEPEKPKKVRGKNKNKDVAGLKPGEKFRVNFYNNRVVGKHQTSFSRHLGILVRDRNMCPLQVHSWKDIGEDKPEHMWRAVTDKFDIMDQLERIIAQDVKFKPLHEALKNVPKEIDKSDWEWLVKEHFLSEKFKETSIKNSINRSKLRMPHRTGSKPIREIIYELAEIQELVQFEPSLTNIEVIERYFGPQNKSHVVGLGCGITTKELKGGSSSKAAILIELNATRKEKESLQTELNATKKAKDSLEKRMDDFESKYDHLISLLVDQPSSAPSTSQQSTS